MQRAFVNSLFSHAEHSLPCALCLFSHSKAILREHSKGFIATFRILPKIPAWYHIPLFPVHRIDLDTEGENTPEGSDKETIAVYVALKIGNEVFQWKCHETSCEVASETVGNEDECAESR